MVPPLPDAPEIALPIVLPAGLSPPPAFPAWAMVTTRDGGVGAAPYASLNLATHVGDDPMVVAENRRRAALAWSLPTGPAWLEQVHGTGVVRVGAVAGQGTAGSAPPVADAAFTTEPLAVVAILTADCLPVVLAERTGRVVGAAHAGWRGLQAGVLEALAGAMRQAVPGAGLLAWFGPCIGPAAFEIGPEVRQAFLDAGDPAAAFVPRAGRPGTWLASLPALARHRLGGMGVDVRFAVDPPCTVHDPRFFSHRAAGPRTGRFATLVRRLPAGPGPSVKPLRMEPPAA